MTRLILRAILTLVVVVLAAATGAAVASLIARDRGPEWPFAEGNDFFVPTVKRASIPTLGGTARFKGTVVAEDGRPIANATVRVSAGLVLTETHTQGSGVFTVEGLPSAPVTVVVAAPGFRPELAGPVLPPRSEVQVTLKAAEPPEPADSSVKQETGSLTILLSSEGGADLPPLSVAVIPETQDGREFALVPRTSDAAPGATTATQLTGLPAGTYRVLVLPRGAPVDSKAALHAARLDVLPGQEQKTARYVVRWGAITGRVLYRNEPVARAFVRVVRRAGASPALGPLEAREIELARTVTNADGSFTLDMLPVGESTLEILSTGFVPWSRSLTVGLETKPLEIELSPKR